VLLCLRLLTTHLSLALAGGVSSTVLGEEAKRLRLLLFRMMDMEVPACIQEVSVFFLLTPNDNSIAGSKRGPIPGSATAAAAPG
jgi:hypothetical protein